MEMQNWNHSNKHLLFRLFCILFLGYVIVYPLDISAIFHVLMFCIYAVVGCISVMYFRGRSFRNNALLQLTCIMFVVFEFMFYGIEVGLDSIQTILCFIFLVILMGAHRDFLCDNRIRNTLFHTCVIAVIVLSFYSFLPFAYYYRGTNIRCPLLTLNLDNANFTGIVLFYLFAVLWIERNNHRWKIFTYLLIIYDIYLIYLTNSRTCLVTVGMVIIYSVFFTRFKIPKWVTLIVLLIPFFFAPFYIYLSSMGNDAMQILGKRVFSGRQDIYLRYLGYMQTLSDWLFGNMRFNFFYNSGNGPLALVCSTGIICTLSFYILNFKQIFLSREEANTYSSRTALIVLLSFAIHTCAESSMVLGGVVSLFAYFTIFILTHDCNSSAEEVNR